MTPRRRWGRVILGTVAIVVLLAGVFAAGIRLGRGDDGSQSGNGGGAGSGTGTGDAGSPAPRAPDLEGTARSVAYQGDVVDVPSLRLVGGAELFLDGEVTDAAGTRLGKGRLVATGTDLTVAGTPFVVAVRTELRLAGGVARILGETSSVEVLRIRRASRLTVAATDVRFTPEKAEAQRPVTGPVSVTVDSDNDVTVQGRELTWEDAPPALRFGVVVTGRSTLSWAGEGVVRAAGAEHRAQFLGLKARELNATAERDAAGVRLRGDAEFVQVYSDGMPQLPAQGRVRIKSRPGTVPRGSRGSFTWAPENDGRTDMTILRIRPENPEAGWVSLGLDELPDMCGGESCTGRGGDTSGFRSGRPINAVILPGTGDERNITFGVPLDTPLGPRTLVLVVEGNFEPIRVEVPFEVVEPPPTTRPVQR